MNEIEKMQRAKMYMDKLANGVNPLDGCRVHEDDIVRDSRIIACLEYVSQVLDNNIRSIDKPEKTTKKRGVKAVYITSEQFAELKLNYGQCKVSDIAGEINRVIAENDTRKMQAKWINDWLESIDMLHRNASGDRIATTDGHNLGISSELRYSKNGEEYYTNYYSTEAQTFIFDNIDAILALRYDSMPVISDKYSNVTYPADMSIRDFIRQNSDKCIMISVGSCDTMQERGSYKSMLLYKGRTKVMQESDIHTRSANQCILKGLQAAANAIKSPSDILILTSTSLGFNKPKSKNYTKCCDIINTLANAGCTISILVCNGRGYELAEFIRKL